MKEIALKPHQIKEKLLIEELKSLTVNFQFDRFAVTNKDILAPLESHYQETDNFIKIPKGMVVGIVKMHYKKLTKEIKFKGIFDIPANLVVYVQSGNIFYKVHIHYKDLTLIKE